MWQRSGLACSAVLLLANCGREPTEAPGVRTTLTVRGSDTMVILSQMWAEEFMEQHPEVSIQVSGGGSGTGLTALVDGSTNIATASRPISPTERERVIQRQGRPPTEVQVATDTVAIYVHRDNPVEALSLAQAQEIFRGRQTEWKTFGPDLGPIILYS